MAAWTIGEYGDLLLADGGKNSAELLRDDENDSTLSNAPPSNAPTVPQVTEKGVVDLLDAVSILTFTHARMHTHENDAF